MVKVDYHPRFKKAFKKMDKPLKIKVNKQIEKIIKNPFIGKPMRNIRKGTRELYIKPLRLSYSYYIEDDLIYLLDIYHKDEQ